MAMTDLQADRVFDSMLVRLENKLSRLILGNFRKLSKLMREVIDNGGEFAGNVIILENQRELERILKEAYFDAIRQGARFSYIDLELDQPDEDDLSALLLLLFGWVTVTAIQHAQFLTDTTIDIFNEEYQSALSTLETGADIGKMVSREMEKRNRSRVPTISKTEANMAFQTGSLQAAKALNIELLKTWRSQENSSVRPTHVSANRRYKKNPIPLDHDFVVGGSLGDRPLDPKLPIQETANCVCYLRFKRPKPILIQ